MTQRSNRQVYIKVRFSYDTYSSELLESLVALPGVESAEQMYPEDPALSNICLVVSDRESLKTVLEYVSNFEYVEFAEEIERPEIR